MHRTHFSLWSICSQFGLAVVSAIVTILTPVAFPLLPIVVPVAAGVVAVAWTYQVYQRT